MVSPSFLISHLTPGLPSRGRNQAICIGAEEEGEGRYPSTPLYCTPTGKKRLATETDVVASKQTVTKTVTAHTQVVTVSRTTSTTTSSTSTSTVSLPTTTLTTLTTLTTTVTTSTSTDVILTTPFTTDTSTTTTTTSSTTTSTAGPYAACESDNIVGYVSGEGIYGVFYDASYSTVSNPAGDSTSCCVACWQTPQGGCLASMYSVYDGCQLLVNATGFPCDTPGEYSLGVDTFATGTTAYYISNGVCGEFDYSS